MTIDEARTWLQRHADNTPMPGAREAYKTVLKVLERTRWIPVTERLPEELEAVNIVWKNNNPEPYYENIKGQAFVATGYYYSGNWYWFSAVCEDYLKEYGKCPMDLVDEGINITHWMPLPEPPEVE